MAACNVPVWNAKQWGLMCREPNIKLIIQCGSQCIGWMQLLSVAIYWGFMWPVLAIQAFSSSPNLLLRCETRFYRHLYSATQNPAKLVVSLLAFIWIHLHANCAALADTKHRWDFTVQDSVQKNHNIQTDQTASRLNQPRIHRSVTILLQSHNYVIITEQSRWEKSC